jgi:transposase InsO family protein
VFFLQDKSETQGTLKRFLRRAQNEFNLRIKKIWSDNGTQSSRVLEEVEGYLEDEGIKHEFSSPYTPQKNGVVERKNRTLIDMVQTMLEEYKTLDWFWEEAINTACHAINRCIFIDSSRRLHMNSSPITNLMYLILEALGDNVILWLRKVEIENLLLKL